MKTQGVPGFVRFRINTKTLVFLCIPTFLGIHGYDGNWNLPILAWQLIGLFAGSALIKIVSGLIIFCWLYLWVLLLQNIIVLNIKLIAAFVGLCTCSIFYGYDQIVVYTILGHLNVNVLFYILPFTFFIICTVLLFKQLKRQ